MEEPFERFATWLAEAEAREPNNPSAMSVATVDAQGRPSVRMLLLRGFDERGFVFYTNLDSRKGRELRERAYAALCFHWKSLDRQVRVEGRIEPVSSEEADAYFASRPKDSQIGAWASQQSQPLKTRFELESRVAKYGLLYGIGKVPRPPFWSGFRVVPDAIEFWEERPFRLHDRTLYKRSDDGWTTTRLFP
ncbi:MAG: pyridoxamine 5'-phosphate oxidase [Gammaproteobacteria bacterium]|nr:pyridoxamine 5'-phosphate oxidase [Gammaproteobacteria bacterium]